MNTIIKLIIILSGFFWLQTNFAATTVVHHKTSTHKIHKKIVHTHRNHKKITKRCSSKSSKKRKITAKQKVTAHDTAFSYLNEYPGLQTNNEEKTSYQPSQSLFFSNQPIALQTPPSFTTSLEQRLVGFVQQSVSRLQYTSYKFGGTHFDTSRGIYIVDCSGYVDNTLRAVYPHAYLSLVDSSGTDKPNSLHYYDFFRGLSSDPDQYWSKVEDVEQLRPGDILVFRYKNSRGRSRSGHVMVVMNQPVRQGNVYLVSVADSASSGHSQDTRTGHGGVGIGTLLLRTNPKTGHPAAFAWKIGAQWKSNVNFAMARPSDQTG